MVRKLKDALAAMEAIVERHEKAQTKKTTREEKALQSSLCGIHKFWLVQAGLDKWRNR